MLAKLNNIVFDEDALYAHAEFSVSSSAVFEKFPAIPRMPALM
jgi:hypothetical protein